MGRVRRTRNERVALREAEEVERKMRLQRRWIDDTKAAHVEAAFFPSRFPPASRSVTLVGLCQLGAWHLFRVGHMLGLSA